MSRLMLAFQCNKYMKSTVETKLKLHMEIMLVAELGSTYRYLAECVGPFACVIADTDASDESTRDV